MDERATILCPGDRVDVAHLPEAISRSSAAETSAEPPRGDPVSLEPIEEFHVGLVPARTRSPEEAADVPRIFLATLWRRRRKEYGI